MSAPTVDPITLEVLRETFSSIVREMRVTLVRTAYSSILYEGEDFSCVLMDGDAQLVAMSKGQDHPLHIVPISWSMKSVKEKFGDDIHPGDVFLHNDPYTGDTHLNDVAMITPLFAPGAAGVIHSDFEKGFIKAEVIAYDDLIALGSEAAARTAGKLRMEGKEYVVRDGDVMHFRFNV